MLLYELGMLLRPIVIAGPSGVGKSTLISKLMQEFPGEYGFSISHTTRQPRSGETNGVQYHFVSRDKMEKEIAEGKFIETAEYSGNLYGTSIEAVQSIQSKGLTCLLDLDIQGVLSMKKKNLNPRCLFIRPPSIDDLKLRLQKRGEKNIQQRIEIAKRELEFAEKSPAIFDQIIVNDAFDESFQKFKNFVRNP